MSFRDLHKPGDPFILANAWDAGSARMLAALGAEAIATSSAAHAFTLGRPDGGTVTRDEALAHAQDIVAAVNVPVSGDFENGFGHSPDECAETVRLAAEVGLAGISIEDAAVPDDKAYPFGEAVERIRAAAAAARALDGARQGALAFGYAQNTRAQLFFLALSVAGFVAAAGAETVTWEHAAMAAVPAVNRKSKRMVSSQDNRPVFGRLTCRHLIMADAGWLLDSFDVEDVFQPQEFLAHDRSSCPFRAVAYGSAPCRQCSDSSDQLAVHARRRRSVHFAHR